MGEGADMLWLTLSSLLAQLTATAASADRGPLGHG